MLDFDKYECYNLPHIATCPGLPISNEDYYTKLSLSDFNQPPTSIAADCLINCEVKKKANEPALDEHAAETNYAPGRN